MKDHILQALRLVEWLSMEDDPEDLVGEDNGDVLDWDSNNVS